MKKRNAYQPDCDPENPPQPPKGSSAVQKSKDKTMIPEKDSS